TKFIVPMDRGRVLNLQGLTGTIWAGGAAETRIAGLSLGKLQWDMHILKLFTGKLALDVILESKEGRIEGEVQAGTGGELTLQSVRGRLPVQTFMPLFYGMPFAVSGSVNADINHAEIIPGKKLVVDGKVIWHAAALTAPQAFEFGDLFMVLRPMPDGSNILLKDQGGPLDLDGNIQIKNSGEYKANLLLGTRGKQDDLELALKILGRTNPQGKVQVSRTGRLQNWR
ncbi:MAG: type II secretion system protein N, partial [Gammaproteobacteria bacterium]|nr:type II secretion system protein N [Gammaproteobacteria bacterium]